MKTDVLNYTMHIPVGKKNAVSGQELATRWGKKDSAQTRQIVNYLRREKVPVCSGPCGYWLSTSEKEIAECANRIYMRAKEEFATARNLSLSSAIEVVGDVG